jgi:hypothetical protein
MERTTQRNFATSQTQSLWESSVVAPLVIVRIRQVKSR